MWGFILRSITFSLHGVIAVPAMVMAVYLPVVLLHTAATSQMSRIEEPRVEVREFGNPEKALRRIRESNFTTVERLNELATNPRASRHERLVYANAPLLLETPNTFSPEDDTPLGVYYTLSISQFKQITVTTIKYYLYFTDENGGTPIEERMARYGHPFDGELIYQVSFIDDRVLSAHYQAPVHRLVPFEHEPGEHPVFAIASPNHNFRRVVRDEGPILAPLPRNELAANPFHNPDFVALAAREAMIQHGLDISRYVYVAFQNPVSRVPVDVSVLVRGQWYHLHDIIKDGILGTSVTVQGYHQVGVRLPFTPRPEDIDEVRIVARNDTPLDLKVFALYIYPEPAVLS